MKRKYAFTILEMMMVLVVMGTLFGLAYVSFSNLMKNNSAHNALALARQADAALINFRTSTSHSDRIVRYDNAGSDAARLNAIKPFWQDAPADFNSLNRLVSPWSVDLPNSSGGTVAIGNNGTYTSLNSVTKIADLPGF